MAFDSIGLSEQAKDLIVSLEALLHLPAGSFDHINADDDWSFVIKTEALVEAAIASALTTITDKAFTPVFSKMTLGGRTGTLAFATAADIITKPQARLVQALLELRNRVAHDIHQIGFTFPTYIDGLSPADFSKFVADMTPGVDSALLSVWEGMVKDHPKDCILLGVLGVVNHTLNVASMVKASQKWSPASAALAVAIVKGTPTGGAPT